MHQIKSMGYYLPENKIEVESVVDSIADIPKLFKNKTEYCDYIKNDLEVESIHYSNLTRREFAVQGVEKFIDENSVDSALIDLIILAKDINTKEEDVALYVKHQLKFLNAETILLAGAQCANFESVLHLIKNGLSNNYQNILIFSYTFKENHQDRVIGTYALEGDAVGCILLTKEPGIISLDASIKKTNSSFHSYGFEQDYSLLHCKMYLELLTDFFKKQQLMKVEEVNKMILQRGNTSLIQQCLGSIGIKKDKYFTSPILCQSGHLDCIDFIVSLQDLYRSGVKGQVLSFGIGWRGVYILSLYSIH